MPKDFSITMYPKRALSKKQDFRDILEDIKAKRPKHGPHDLITFEKRLDSPEKRCTSVSKERSLDTYLPKVAFYG